MTDPTLTITISRTSLSLSPLVLSGTYDSNALGVTNYQPPAEVPRYGWAPDSADVNGSELISVALEQANLSFDVVTDQATTATVSQSLRDQVRAAVGQFSFTVTTQVDGAPAEVWSASRGQFSPAPRTYEDMANHNPTYSVTIPVYPIAS